MRSFFALVTVVSLVGCDDGAPEPMDVTIDTFNVGLAGAFIPYEEERRAPLAEAIAASEADVICLQEVWNQSDKDLIIAAAAESFPHSVAFEHDLDTPIDDPTDQSGEVPPSFDSPPCAAEELQSQLEAALTCLQENCSTIPGSEDGQTTSTACAQEHCVTHVSAMLLGDEEALRCYGCLAPSLPTSTFAELRQSCTEEVNSGLAFDGQSGVMILSRHPVRDGRAHVLPGTWNRRVIALATVELPNEAEVDVYCNHLTPMFDALTYPYTGQYGMGEFDDDGWAAEQLLQAEKLVTLVEAETGQGRAFILGDFNTGRASGDTLHDEAVETLELLENAFTPAVTEDFTPECTHCPDNANTSDASTPVWIDHIFMTNIPADAVVATERTYDEAVVEVDDGAQLVPLSDHYGLRAVVTIEP